MAHIWGKRIGTTGLATVLTLSMAACGGQSAGSDPSAAPTQGGSEGESTKVLEVWLPAKGPGRRWAICMLRCSPPISMPARWRI